MENSINAPNAILSTSYLVNNVNLNALIGILVTIIFAFNAIKLALIAKARLQINVLVVPNPSFFLNNSAFLPALIVTILI